MLDHRSHPEITTYGGTHDGPEAHHSEDWQRGSNHSPQDDPPEHQGVRQRERPDGPVAFYELVMLARDPSREVWGDYALGMEGVGLTQTGVMHDAVRDIVLACAEGEGIDTYMVSPLPA